MCTVTKWERYEELGNEYVTDCAVSNPSRPLKDEFLEPLFQRDRIDLSQMHSRNSANLIEPAIVPSLMLQRDDQILNTNLLGRS